MPSLIGIESIHAPENLKRIRSQILLVNGSVVANDERLHSGDAILRRRCGQCEPANHSSLNDKVDLPQRRGRTLPLQNLEIVAVVGLTSIRVRITLLKGLGHSLSDRASPSAIRVLPRQPVMFPRCADDSLRVLVYLGIIVLFLGVIFLRFDEAAADLNSVQFVGPDAPSQNFIASRLGVEVPLSLALHDRNRKRKIIVTHEENGAVWMFLI